MDDDLDTIDIDELRSLNTPEIYSPLDSNLSPEMQTAGYRGGNIFSYETMASLNDVNTLPVEYENSWVNTDMHRSPPTSSMTSPQYFAQQHPSAAAAATSNCRLIPSPLESYGGNSAARRGVSTYPYNSSNSSASPCTVARQHPHQLQTAAFGQLPQRPTPVYNHRIFDVSPESSAVFLTSSQRQQLLLNDNAECQLLQQSIAESEMMLMSADSTNKKKGSRRGRRAALNDLEPQTKTAIRQDRRRQSNRRAAEKYRIKQRAQTEGIKTEKERLAQDNDELRAENLKLRDELDRYRDYFTKHSIICPLMIRNNAQT